MGARTLAVVVALAGSVVATAAGAIGSTGRPSPAQTARDLCAAPAGRVTGSLAERDLEETSGLAWSRVHPGVLWAHNDSGGLPRIHAVRRNGSAQGTVTVTGATALDWEDIALGRGPDGRDHLFLADIGGGISTVTVYRIPEPVPPGPGEATTSQPAGTLTLRYPDGPHDAEALLVDDRTGDLVVITKTEGPAGVYRAAGAATASAAPTSASPIPLERVGKLARPTSPAPTRRLQEAVGLSAIADRVTAADASASAGVVAVRTYAGVAVHRWGPDRTLAEALAAVPCAAPAATDLRFPQGEAIALSPNGRRYVMASEGVSAPLVEVRARKY